MLLVKLRDLRKGKNETPTITTHDRTRGPRLRRRQQTRAAQRDFVAETFEEHHVDVFVWRGCENGGTDCGCVEECGDAVILLSTDPSIRGTAGALFRDGKLIAAAYVESPAATGRGPRECEIAAAAVNEWAANAAAACGIFTMRDWIDKLVCETPQIYTMGDNKTKGDPNLLLSLAGINASLATLHRHAEVTHYTPFTWKQNTHKPKRVSDGPYVISTRLMSRLSDDEKAVFKWPGSAKEGYDVADAIAIGMFHLGRFERKRIFARE